MESELRKIKKKYGEEMMKFCRDNFSTVLETPGLMYETLTSNFEPNKDLYFDLEENDMLLFFKNYIFSKITNEEEEEKKEEILSPKEIFESIGYDFYECKTEEEIQKFRKYYDPKELICTIRNGGRLKSNHVFFVVRKDVDNIKREDYKKPKRQDKYGTSVMSIQFTRDSSHTLSIKNRYNHTVDNPDATYSNDLENICPGLTESFEHHYGLVQQHKSKSFEIPRYVKANDGKYYKYTYELDNKYYCPNNIIIDNFEVKRYEKEKYIIFDYFILDLVNKKIECTFYYPDGFVPENPIKNIEIRNIDDKKRVIITFIDNMEYNILLDKNNEMIELESNAVHIRDYFLLFSQLQRIKLPNVVTIGDVFLYKNKKIKCIELPNVKRIGREFLPYNYSIKKIYLPNVVSIGEGFLCYNNSLQSIYSPNLKQIGEFYAQSCSEAIKSYINETIRHNQQANHQSDGIVR